MLEAFMKKNTKIDARHLRRLAGHYTISEVATELQMNIWTAYNQVREGRCLPPTTTITGGASAASQHDFGIANMETPAIMRRILKQ
ncbi:MAG: hypothetical protein ABSA77_06500, partial [Thermoguttaceae bacterium]